MRSGADFLCWIDLIYSPPPKKEAAISYYGCNSDKIMIQRGVRQKLTAISVIIQIRYRRDGNLCLV